VKGLAAALDARARRALRRGALEPVESELVWLEDEDVAFAVRVVAALERKRAAPAPPGGDPFLPYDEELHVADVSDTHVALLNRFPVMERHLLIVTRDFEDQERPLTRADLGALAACMAELPGLGFYNAGRAAGASQPHKHLQLVPEGPDLAIPLEARIRAAALPFAHAVAHLEPGSGGDAELLHRAYETLRAGWRGPYNLLVTGSWMLFVPRARECWEGVSVNALGFAGSLLARSREELERIRRVGPMNVLRNVARLR